MGKEKSKNRKPWGQIPRFGLTRLTQSCFRLLNVCARAFFVSQQEICRLCRASYRPKSTTYLFFGDGKCILRYGEDMKYKTEVILMNKTSKTGKTSGLTLTFNHKRSCGLWLILVGTVLAVSTLLGGSFLANPIIFLVGYYVSFYVANINRKIRQKLSAGPASPFQIRMIYLSIALLFVLMFLIAGPFIPSCDSTGTVLGESLHMYNDSDRTVPGEPDFTARNK